MGLSRTLWKTAAALDGSVRFSSLWPESNDAVVSYHSVGNTLGRRSVSTERLRRDLQLLTDRYSVVDLSALGTNPQQKQVALTFDDGYRDFYTNALPLLEEFGTPATVFLVTDFVGPSDSDILEARLGVEGLTNEHMLSESQVRDLVETELVSIGNHSRTHPNLTSISDNPERLNEEINGAKRRLEERFGVAVDHFCYPMGRYDRRVIEYVKETHEMAVTTQRGIPEPSRDPYRLPRVLGDQSEAMFRWELTDVSNFLAQTVDALGVN